MYKNAFTLLALVAPSFVLAAPEHIIEERHIIEIEKRQADVNQLLQLASLAGITALPTDPAVLLQLGPLANSLASALPTPPVLSELMTAAPSGFVSQIVNDPSYANSFESAFSAGSSPSWFLSLPTSAQSYLHTYTGFGELATAAAAVQNGANGGQNGTGSTSGTASIASGSGASMTSGMSASSASAASASKGMSTTSSGASADQSGSSTSSGSGSSASKAGDAAHATGALSAGIAGMVGILGVAVLL